MAAAWIAYLELSCGRSSSAHLAQNLERRSELLIVTRPLRSPRRFKPEVKTMVEDLRNMLRPAMVLVVGALFTACNGAPSDSEFVAACMNEGQGVASQMLDRESGITRDAFCKCGAPVARASLSSDGYRAMILDMQGKREEARNITSTMSESEQQAALEVLGEMLEKCGGAAQ